MKLTALEAADFLKSRDGFLILTHRRPDGDTIGCAIALCRALRHAGKTAFLLPNADATSLFDPYWGDKAACGEILYKSCLSLLDDREPLPRDVALPLYLAVSTDTGCFVYANTTANTHTVAAALMAAGIDFKAVNKRHFRTKSYVRLRLESRMIETMDLHHSGQTAIWPTWAPPRPTWRISRRWWANWKGSTPPSPSGS